jgi:hypothetical protein
VNKEKRTEKKGGELKRYERLGVRINLCSSFL